LREKENEKERERVKTNRIYAKSFMLICNAIDWWVEGVKHEMHGKAARPM